MNAFEIKKIIDDNRNEYCYFGLRAMTQNPITGENTLVSVNDILAESFDWADGESLGRELNGASALAIDLDAEIKDIEKVITAVKKLYSWSVKQIVVCASMVMEYGEDNNEIIMHNAVVLEVWNI